MVRSVIMGMWGYGVMENDLALDIKHEFLLHFDHGVKVPRIRRFLLKRFREEARSKESFLFWLPLVYCEWESGVLEPFVYEKVRTLVIPMINHDYIIPLGGSEADATEQVESYVKFMNDIFYEHPNPRKPQSPIKIEPTFKSGDFVVFRLSTGLYGGFYVTGAYSLRKYVELGYNTFIALDINLARIPNLNDFKKSGVINFSSLGYRRDKRTLHFLASDLMLARTPNPEFKVIGNIPCRIANKKGPGKILWNVFLDKLEYFFSNPPAGKKKIDTLSHRISTLHNPMSESETGRVMIILLIIAGIMYLLLKLFG